jgi:hypothetical protein
MCFAAIESGDLVSATKRVTDLIRPGESGAAKNQDIQRFHGFLGNQFAYAKCGGGRCRKLDELAACG